MNDESEINVEELKARIREAVTRRQAEGKISFVNASAELYKLLALDDSLDPLLPAAADESETAQPIALTRLRLQPEFQPHSNDRYHVNDLLQYHDHEFIWNAYRALLKREPDEEGYNGYLKRLRSGRRNKIDILSSLRTSPEGQRANVSIEGLSARAVVRRLFHLPVLGYLAELVAGVVRLPALLRSQRQLENHLVAQQERLASHIDQTNHLLMDQLRAVDRSAKSSHNEVLRSHGELLERMNELVRKQKEVAELQHQQVSALFQEQQKLVFNSRARPSENGHSLTSLLEQKHHPDHEVDVHKLLACFNDQFRGDAQTLRQELRRYLLLLRDSGMNSNILDIGSGYGDWLGLLKAEGLNACGVESNPVLVAAARSKGLDVVESDAHTYLRRLPDASLDAVTGFHVLEHLHFQQLVAVLAEISRTLRPGGLVVFETPNPKNLVVGACNFYADPTHHKPLFPETMQLLLDTLGFERVQVEYLHPVAESPFKNNQPGSRELDIWLFGPRDFAVIGWKRST